MCLIYFWQCTCSKHRAVQFSTIPVPTFILAEYLPSAIEQIYNQHKPQKCNSSEVHFVFISLVKFLVRKQSGLHITCILISNS